MNDLEILGKVGATSIGKRIRAFTDSEDEGFGVARFMLDRLTGKQVASIAKSILEDSETSERVAIFLPRALVDGHLLPETIVTDKRTVEHRHSVCNRPAMLLANTDDDQATSLQDIILIGAEELLSDATSWVSVASQGLPLTDDQREIWSIAIAGLLSSIGPPLYQVARYVAQTRAHIGEESVPIRDALGWALPALQFPRDSQYFQSMSEIAQRRETSWRRLFNKLESRGLLLRKMRSPRQQIEKDELFESYKRVEEEIVEGHEAILRFIDAPGTWCPESAQLAEYEWEQDGITQLFSGLKRKRISLGEETITFFELEDPDALSDEEREYLDDLSRRRSLKDANEDDVSFFEAHREEFNSDRKLRAKWERFVFGKPIECTDFLVGLVHAVDRIWGQVDTPALPRKLIIKTTVGRGRGRWLELNEDVVRYFSVRYRGLDALLGDLVDWETEYLFRFDELTAWARQNNSKYRPNASRSRAATQIKFNIELQVGEGDSADRYPTQLIWRFVPDAIGLELPSDLKRIQAQPMTNLSVSRQLVSQKGNLQAVSLNNVRTLDPAFGRDSGSLVSRTGELTDAFKTVLVELEDAERSNRIDGRQKSAITKALGDFKCSYEDAINAFVASGLKSMVLIEQANAYGSLLEVLSNECSGDVNRQQIWRPIVQIGLASVEGGTPAAIVAPWHPLRLCALAAKARQVSGLIRHILTSETVDFGDRRLFFSDTCSSLEHAYYPEIAVGHRGNQPVLLACSDTFNDYTLMEQPFLDQSDSPTGVEPGEAAKQIRALLDQYLDLQPHEQADLSLLLYNCDSAGLPLKTVEVLNSVRDGQNVNCSVVLRHRDREQLARVYKELVERTGEDPDSAAPSETASDFMSKLRIGIMLDETRAARRLGSGRNFDIAFMHDVVSRQSQEAWLKVTHDWRNADTLDHAPNMWAYNRLSSDDELKATSYLSCPKQTEFGWQYVRSIAAIVQRQTLPAGERCLPARQISFQDNRISSVLNEIHELAEWVVNYDDLLDRRQLQAQGIQVIRYKRGKTHGRNLVVSSTTDLRVLRVLVERRLKEIGIDLESEPFHNLAPRLIEDASSISGNLVLRAAKRGVSAGELIGVVLSKFLAASEISRSTPRCWISLDDYAEWLGQREEEIADLMALAIEESDERPLIRLIATEAKYVAGTNRAEAKRKSRRQTRDTVSRFESAFFGDPGRLDRDLWLGRISGLLVDHVDEFHNLSLIEEVRDRLMTGDVDIDLRGYSHVFVHGPQDEDGQSEQEPIEKLGCGLQEIFNRKSTRELVAAYASGEDPAVVRASLGDDKPWDTNSPRRPQQRISWAVAGSVLPSSSEQSEIEMDPTTAGSETSAKIDKPVEGPSAAQTKDPVARTQSPRETSAFATQETSPKAEISIYPSSLAALIEERARPDDGGDEESLSWLAETKKALRQALIGYGLQGKVVGERLTPNAALVRFKGSDRLRVSDVERYQSSLLTTHGLNVISVSAQPHEVVVTIARPMRETVSLWNVWSQRQINRKASGLNLSFILGTREIDGELLYLNLTDAFGGMQRHDPHTLVAGATGSGKSVLLQCLLLDIAATNSPDLAHVYLIDPKMGVDYAALERLPHLQGGIITDQDEALSVLSSLVSQMDERYSIFREARVKDLHSYNLKVAPEQRIPALWVFHDEFAEWMLVDDYKEGVTNYVQRLGVKARAAGIYLVFAAQRPEANVMPMQLRENLGNRLILRVSSTGSSEIALGQKGAERLLGLGHLAARLTGEADLIYAQCAFLPDKDLEDAVSAICADNSR